MNFRLLWISGWALLSVACSSALKEQCEKQDWFSYGKELALRGDRPGGDDYLRRCKKEGAEFSEVQVDQGFKAGRAQYCLPEQARVTGKMGYVFNPEMCSEGEFWRIKKDYFEGLDIYCRPDSGFRLGTSGQLYSKVCRKDQELAYMPQYLCGRQIYLQNEVTSLKKNIQSEIRSIDQIDRGLASNETQMRMLPSPTIEKHQVYNPEAQKYEERVSSVDPFATERHRLEQERDKLLSQFRHAVSDRSRFEAKLKTTVNELEGMEKNLACQPVVGF